MLLSVVCKLHNLCMERNLDEHVGRVMSDTYGQKTRRGDLWGGDWADWRVPDDSDDDVDKITVPHWRRNYQRRRDELCQALREHGRKRPERSSYQPARKRRRRRTRA